VFLLTHMGTTDVRRVVQVSFRIPKSLIEIVYRFIEMDTHCNPSEFFRDAIREKIRREAPDLFSSIFKEFAREAEA